ncbi:hypothetical protein [Albibacterium indicum]|uniref:hypothetical protein n=1 Tax=Albibacterium indicum TaxID=2292082 RepID=UPI001300AFB0|nr:hypothetical protein [Pedobacter indicus]
MEFRWSGLRSRFRVGNAVLLSSHDSYQGRQELTEWKGEISDGVQDFLGKRYCPECSFSRNEGEYAE